MKRNNALLLGQATEDRQYEIRNNSLGIKGYQNKIRQTCTAWDSMLYAI